MKTEQKTLQKVISKVIAMSLYSITAVLSVYEIFMARNMVISAYNHLIQRYDFPSTVLERLSAAATGNITALLMAIIAIVIVVGGFDFHWSHAGEPRSFKIFGWTFAFQITFMALYFLLK
ncbi:MAG: hypothetical protein MUO76_10780 [Anaerolineaceae bacterium]|nr:hypothetical protein [Anaerolineaceae bacterium]